MSIRQYLDVTLYPTKLRSGTRVEHLTMAAALVAVNLGTIIIPASALFQLRLPELAVRPLLLLGLVRTSYVVRHSRRSLSVTA